MAPESLEPTRSLIVGRPPQYRRLDQFVTAALAPEWSRTQVGRMIKAGVVTVNGTTVRASCAIRPGDKVEIVARIARPTAAMSQLWTRAHGFGALEVLFSDQELLVVNKPAGMPVHPSPGHPDSTMADALIQQFPDLQAMVEPDGLMRAGIVHRLDKETSGVIVVARTPFARKALSQQFKERSVSKIYLAIAHGIVAADRFMVDRPVGRHPTERKRMSVRSHKLREAHTEFIVLHRLVEPVEPVTLLMARPRTGRTHQIRVHLASSGHPCIADRLYRGKAVPGWTREGQALHALALRITHPRSGEVLEFIAPLPEDFAKFLSASDIAVGAAIIGQWLAL